MIDDKEIAAALANPNEFWTVRLDTLEGMTANRWVYDVAKFTKILVDDAIHAQRKIHYDENGVLIGNDGNAQLLQDFLTNNGAWLQRGGQYAERKTGRSGA